MARKWSELLLVSALILTLSFNLIMLFSPICYPFSEAHYVGERPLGKCQLLLGGDLQERKAHRQTNVLFGHKIPVAETDAFESLPVSSPFEVTCNECGHESSYTPEEVMRVEFFQLPASFAPHPRFV